MLDKSVLKRIQVAAGEAVRLKKYETGWTHIPELKGKGPDGAKEEAKKVLNKNIEDLAEAQELLYASDSHSLLIVLQGMDASGKDGTIKHVMSGINPQGCFVHSFKQPTDDEVSHTFLWRYSRATPERGRISLFNRSYYEEVLVVRVHPEWLLKQHVHPGKKQDIWGERYEDINSFERHLVRNGIVVLKFFLHVSKEEQRERLLARLENADKFWKFSPSDLKERGYWKEYVEAYEQAITATNTPWAPWYIIPADYKWAAHTLVADVITTTIHSLELSYPTIDKKTKKQIEKARKILKKE